MVGSNKDWDFSNKTRFVGHNRRQMKGRNYFISGSIHAVSRQINAALRMAPESGPGTVHE